MCFVWKVKTDVFAYIIFNYLFFFSKLWFWYKIIMIFFNCVISKFSLNGNTTVTFFCVSQRRVCDWNCSVSWFAFSITTMVVLTTQVHKSYSKHLYCYFYWNYRCSRFPELHSEVFPPFPAMSEINKCLWYGKISSHDLHCFSRAFSLTRFSAFPPHNFPSFICAFVYNEPSSNFSFFLPFRSW